MSFEIIFLKTYGNHSMIRYFWETLNLPNEMGVDHLDTVLNAYSQGALIFFHTLRRLFYGSQIYKAILIYGKRQKWN